MLRLVLLLALVAAVPVDARAQVPPPPPCLSLVPADADWVAAAGHHKKRVGAILMASGSTLMVVGTGLSILGWWDHDDRCVHGYGYDDEWCHHRALALAGATTTALGVGALVPGIIEWTRGANEVDAAAAAWRCTDGSAPWRRPAAP